jgi:hypothetical protein
MINNDVQNITQKTRDLVTRNHGCKQVPRKVKQFLLYGYYFMEVYFVTYTGQNELYSKFIKSCEHLKSY